MKKKIFYPIVGFLVYFLAFAYVQPFQNFMVGVFDGRVIAGSSKNIKAVDKGRGKGKGRKQRKPINFVTNVLVTGVDIENGKLMGIGQTGSFTGREFLYDEIEYDFLEARIENREGTQVSADSLVTVKRVNIHGKNNKDGTFSVKRVVIEE